MQLVQDDYQNQVEVVATFPIICVAHMNMQILITMKILLLVDWS